MEANRSNSLVGKKPYKTSIVGYYADLVQYSIRHYDDSLRRLTGNDIVSVY